MTQSPETHVDLFMDPEDIKASGKGQGQGTEVEEGEGVNVGKGKAGQGKGRGQGKRGKGGKGNRTGAKADKVKEEPLVTEADHLNDKPEDPTLAADAAASADLLEALEGPSRPSGYHAISAQAKSAHGNPGKPPKKVIHKKPADKKIPPMATQATHDNPGKPPKKPADKKIPPKMARTNVYSRAYHSTLQQQKALWVPIDLAKGLARAAGHAAVKAWKASLDPQVALGDTQMALAAAQVGHAVAEAADSEPQGVGQAAEAPPLEDISDLAASQAVSPAQHGSFTWSIPASWESPW